MFDIADLRNFQLPSGSPPVFTEWPFRNLIAHQCQEESLDVSIALSPSNNKIALNFSDRLGNSKAHLYICYLDKPAYRHIPVPENLYGRRRPPSTPLGHERATQEEIEEYEPPPMFVARREGRIFEGLDDQDDDEPDDEDDDEDGEGRDRIQIPRMLQLRVAAPQPGLEGNGDGPSSSDDESSDGDGAPPPWLREGRDGAPPPWMRENGSGPPAGGENGAPPRVEAATADGEPPVRRMREDPEMDFARITPGGPIFLNFVGERALFPMHFADDHTIRLFTYERSRTSKTEVSMRIYHFDLANENASAGWEVKRNVTVTVPENHTPMAILSDVEMCSKKQTAGDVVCFKISAPAPFTGRGRIIRRESAVLALNAADGSYKIITDEEFRKEYPSEPRSYETVLRLEEGDERYNCKVAVLMDRVTEKEISRRELTPDPQHGFPNLNPVDKKNYEFYCQWTSCRSNTSLFYFGYEVGYYHPCGAWRLDFSTGSWTKLDQLDPFAVLGCHCTPEGDQMFLFGFDFQQRINESYAKAKLLRLKEHPSVKSLSDLAWNNLLQSQPPVASLTKHGLVRLGLRKELPISMEKLA